MKTILEWQVEELETRIDYMILALVMIDPGAAVWIMRITDEESLTKQQILSAMEARFESILDQLDKEEQDQKDLIFFMRRGW